MAKKFVGLKIHENDLGLLRTDRVGMNGLLCDIASFKMIEFDKICAFCIEFIGEEVGLLNET